MKFRYKVLIVNIILLSIGIATIGYFMIDKNIQLAMDSKIKNTIEENNMLQTAFEYQLLDFVHYDKNTLSTKIEELAPLVTTGISANQSEIFVLYDGQLLFNSMNYPGTKEITTLQNLSKSSANGSKQYEIVVIDGKHYIYGVSCSEVSKAKLNLVNKRDISDVYVMMDNQTKYFIVLLLIIISICSAAMYFISILLTKPLEKLSKVSKSFGEGDYSARADIKSNDEIGDLAITYNEMAGSVSSHVDELEDMIKRQDQFIADFTHEIKTPMTSIIGYADTIRSRELSRENQVMSASYIFNEGKRLETMSMKLFDLIYTKQKSIERKLFPVENLMTSVKDSISPSLDTKKIDLKFYFDNATINGDIDLLKSAFINLIDNARKASTENSTIKFIGKNEANGYKISVEDNGIGISEEHLSRITDAFYMVDKSRSRKEGGAGLGLSLALLIFNHHNALFDIKSELGVGTCITITFPNKQVKEGNN